MITYSNPDTLTAALVQNYPPTGNVVVSVTSNLLQDFLDNVSRLATGHQFNVVLRTDLVQPTVLGSGQLIFFLKKTVKSTYLG